MKRLIAVLALLPSLAGAGETFRKTVVEPITSPHLVGFASYNSTAPDGESKFSVGITANILGPRLGDWPCNIGGFGIGLETIAPGLEDVSIARASVPVLTCAPFKGRVVLQGGALAAIGGATAGDKTFYGGVGVNLTTSVEEMDVKRIARIAAKKQKAILDLQDEARRAASAQ